MADEEPKRCDYVHRDGRQCGRVLGRARKRPDPDRCPSHQKGGGYRPCASEECKALTRSKSDLCPRHYDSARRRERRAAARELKARRAAVMDVIAGTLADDPAAESGESTSSTPLLGVGGINNCSRL